MATRKSAAPKMATLADKAGAEVLTASGTNRAPRKRGRKAATGINLKSVAEALVLEGLDPAVEFARILKPVEEVDPDTGETVMKHQLDPDTRARMLSEILQYTQPKLKAVEVKMSGSLDLLSEEQLDNRLQALLSKAK